MERGDVPHAYMARMVDLVFRSVIGLLPKRKSAMAAMSRFTLRTFSGEVEMAYSAAGRYLHMTMQYLLWANDGMLECALMSAITPSILSVQVLLWKWRVVSR